MKNLQNRKKVVDTVHCSYWWIMYLDRSIPSNTKETLTGYSKYQNEAEANDKLNCLIAKINMLQKNGWIDKSHKIDIYKKMGALPSKSDDRLILTLTKNDFYAPENLALKMPFILKSFLDKFYLLRSTGDTSKVKYLLPLPDKSYSKDDQYNIKKHFFKSIHDLHTWCEKKLAEGEAKDLVLNFYSNYLLKNF